MWDRKGRTNPLIFYENDFYIFLNITFYRSTVLFILSFNLKPTYFLFSSGQLVSVGRKGASGRVFNLWCTLKEDEVSFQISSGPSCDTGRDIVVTTLANL